ncbi:MAG: hypothetical protein IT480_02500 [Gammaproteobacteria bacterium]|nr:hypothetical protein [Gammaproteobacteria bacterium]
MTKRTRSSSVTSASGLVVREHLLAHRPAAVLGTVADVAAAGLCQLCLVTMETVGAIAMTAGDRDDIADGD